MNRRWLLLVKFSPALKLKRRRIGSLKEIVEKTPVRARKKLYRTAGADLYACPLGRVAFGVQPTLAELAVVSEEPLVGATSVKITTRGVEGRAVTVQVQDDALECLVQP